MFTWRTVHFIHVCVDNVCICEYDNSIPKENLPPPLPLPYPQIYPIIVPGIISYANTPHFVIVFVDAVHVYEYQILNLTRIKIESLFILYVTLQIFLNRTDAVNRIGTIHTSLNKFGKF